MRAIDGLPKGAQPRGLAGAETQPASPPLFCAPCWQAALARIQPPREGTFDNCTEMHHEPAATPSEEQAALGKDSGLEASGTGFWLSSAPTMLDDTRQTASFSAITFEPPGGLGTGNIAKERQNDKRSS